MWSHVSIFLHSCWRQLTSRYKCQRQYDATCRWNVPSEERPFADEWLMSDWSLECAHSCATCLMSDWLLINHLTMHCRHRMKQKQRCFQVDCGQNMWISTESSQKSWSYWKSNELYHPNVFLSSQWPVNGKINPAHDPAIIHNIYCFVGIVAIICHSEQG